MSVLDLPLYAQVLRGVAMGLQQSESDAELSRQRGESLGLYDWARHFLPHYFKHPPSALHLWLAEQCDLNRTRRGARVNVLGPRGAAKSTIITLASNLRDAVEGREALIWLVSETSEQAESELANIKAELTDNEILARAYPDACGKGPQWRSGSVRLRNGVAIEAYGIGMKIRGRKKGASRPTKIVCDDIQSDNVMTSGDLRAKHWKWFNGSLLKAGTKRTHVFNLATALHREAIGLRLFDSPGWISKRFQSIIRWPDNMGLWEQWADIYHQMDNPNHEADAQAFYEAHRDKMHAGAVVLWPEEEDLLTLMKMREEGHGEFEREKQCRPANPDEAEWPDSYFDEHIWFDEWPRTWNVKTMALDPSKGNDSKRSDYSAYVMLQVSDGILYVDADLQRRPTPQIVSDGVTLYRQFKPDRFGVEGNCNQDLLAPYFRQEFEARNMFGIEPVSIDNGKVNKQVRIRTLGPYLAKRMLRFKRGSAGALLLVSQLKDFPDKHVHDDGPDALEMAKRLALEMINGYDAMTGEREYLV